MEEDHRFSPIPGLSNPIPLRDCTDTGSLTCPLSVVNRQSLNICAIVEPVHISIKIGWCCLLSEDQPQHWDCHL